MTSDWETVRRGEYEDPHGLQLHPLVECNTQYFPKLCLEEEPTVDLESHQSRHFEGHIPTPLNDNQIYALQQAKYRAEFEAFTWSRDDAELSTTEEEEDIVTPILKRHDSVEETAIDENVEAVLPASTTLEKVVEVESLLVQLEILESPLSVHLEHDEEPVPTTSLGIDGDDPPNTIQHIPTMLRSPSTPDSQKPPSLSLGLPAKTESPPSSPLTDLMPVGVEPERKEAVLSGPIPIPACPFPLRDRPNALPQGLPASGLSVSDVFSVPSPGPTIPNRLIHRHPLLPIEDTIPTARLSVEMNGTIRSLDDEEWEELSSEGIESLPNGHPRGAGPSTLIARSFSGMLRRRPSTIVGSGLRRQAKSSDSSRDSSPTKLRPAPSPAFFATRSLKTTKRAFERLKTFPRLKKGVEGKITPFITSLPEEVDGTTGFTTPSRPANLRRHTESGTGWFDKRPRIRKQASASPPRTTKPSASSSELSISGPEAPRVELMETPPVVWELSEKNLP